MNSHYLKVAVLVVVAAVAIYLIPHHALGPKPGDFTNGPTPAPSGDVVTDFESCAMAGYPIMESYPLQCRANGVTYAQKITSAKVVLDTPLEGDLVASPLKIKGRAQNNWFFEANIPVTLKDENGKVLAHQGFHSTTDWMQPGYVEFEGTLTFAKPTTQFGVLIIEKDNPSGMPENDDSFAIAVRLK